MMKTERLLPYPGRAILAGALMGLTLTLLMGCSRTIERRNPLGEPFPAVQGKRLTDEAVAIPGDFAGKPVLLLVGYVQNAQFDIDRWLLGLAQAGTPVQVLEVPTIRGWVPRAISGWIDSGMRSGIPEEDWRIVATVYKDAPRIVDFLGNVEPINSRVVLLDAEGRVHWMHDRGYSASKLMELDEQVRQLNRVGPADGAEASSEEELSMTEGLDRFKSVMNRLNAGTIGLIDDVYTGDVRFVDPLHEINGREALREYYARMYENVASCEFEFVDQVRDESSASLVWIMRMRHKNFRSDETLELPGMSFLRFEGGRVAHHHDSFDLGAMIYERVPVVGAVVRHIKGRI